MGAQGGMGARVSVPRCVTRSVLGMAQQDRIVVELARYVDSVGKLDPGAVLEMAAFGALLDWEIVNFLADVGLELVRLSFTFKEEETLLVVKVREDGLPYVVFVSRPTPIACVRTFVRKVTNGDLSKYPDRYA